MSDNRRQQIVLLAIEVFGDKKRAGKWLVEANRALSGESPWRLLTTKNGGRTG